MAKSWFAVLNPIVNEHSPSALGRGNFGQLRASRYGALVQKLSTVAFFSPRINYENVQFRACLPSVLKWYFFSWPTANR